MNKPWPISYDGVEFEIAVRILEREHHISARTENHRRAFRAVFHFLNEISWFEDARVGFLYGSHSSHHVEATYSVSTERYLGRFEQRVRGERGHLALGLYREAAFYRSPYYRFACLWRILEVPFARGRERVSWIEGASERLRGKQAVRLRDTGVRQFSEKGLADWLYDVRHRVSHSRYGDATIDPNDFDDWEEVQWANVALEELAAMVIVERLGVPTGRAYEYRGKD